MQWIVLCLISIISNSISAHEIQSVTQHVNLRRQNESGWQQDLIGRVEVNRKFDVGLQGTYLERFDLFEKRAGGFLTYRPTDSWTLEARYLQGMGNEIMPEKDIILSAYHSYAQGLAPFIYYRDSRYSATRVHTASVGVEIEKIPNIIIIPSVMLGRATFQDPADTDDVFNVGLRATYYQEKNFSFSVFGFKGKEASQAIIGRAAVLVDTLTGGAAAGYYFTPEFRAELIFDHTDYDELETEFHTTTLNLSRMF